MTAPKYKEIVNHIARKISDGEWKVDEKIPSEIELSKVMSASRMTVRKAIDKLVEKNILYRKPSVGTFISPQKAQSSFLNVKNISDEIAERGHQHTMHLLSKMRIIPNETIANSLEIPIKTPVYRVVILHREDNVPFQLEERFVNAEMLPDFLSQDFNNITCNEYLSKAMPLTSAEVSIEAIMPPEILRQQLKMNASEPCLKVTRITQSDSVTVSFVNLYHPANLFKLTGKIVTV